MSFDGRIDSVRVSDGQLLVARKERSGPEGPDSSLRILIEREFSLLVPDLNILVVKIQLNCLLFLWFLKTPITSKACIQRRGG